MRLDCTITEASLKTDLLICPRHQRVEAMGIILHTSLESGDTGEGEGRKLLRSAIAGPSFEVSWWHWVCIYSAGKQKP